VEQERRKGIVSSLLCKEDQTDWYYAFSRNYDKTVHVLAWVLRFVNSCCKTKANQGSGKNVLIGTENSKRADWPLAVVEELIPGRDGKVRLVKLRTASGILLRPVQRIYPLEITMKGYLYLRRHKWGRIAKRN